MKCQMLKWGLSSAAHIYMCQYTAKRVFEKTQALRLVLMAKGMNVWEFLFAVMILHLHIWEQLLTNKTQMDETGDKI